MITRKRFDKSQVPSTRLFEVDPYLMRQMFLKKPHSLDQLKRWNAKRKLPGKKERYTIFMNILVLKEGVVVKEELTGTLPMKIHGHPIIAPIAT